MIGVPIGLPQSRDVPTAPWHGRDVSTAAHCMVGVPTSLPYSRDVCSMVGVPARLPYIVGMYLVHGMAEMCYCGTEQ